MRTVATAGLLLERYSNPHYFAPATGLVLLLVMLGAQYLKVKFGYRVFGAFVVLFFAVAAIQASRLTVDEYPHKLFVAHRGGLIHRLESASGRHLVLVRYAPDHNVMEEWIPPILSRSLTRRYRTQLRDRGRQRRRTPGNPGLA